MGKETYAMAVIGDQGAVSHSNGRTSNAGRAALYEKLKKADRVAIKAGNMGFIMAKEMTARVECVVVATDVAPVKAKLFSPTLAKGFEGRDIASSSVWTEK
jgi:hypothetical protein